MQKTRSGSIKKCISIVLVVAMLLGILSNVALASDNYDRGATPAAPGVDFFRETFSPADDTLDFTITADSGSSTISIVRQPEPPGPPQNDPGIIVRPGQGGLVIPNLTRTIERDAASPLVNIEVLNVSTNPIEFYLVSFYGFENNSPLDGIIYTNPFPDLILSFVDSGSADEPLVILPGETLQVPLTLFAHLAQYTIYNIPITAFVVKNGESVEDATATLTVLISEWDFSLNIQQTAFDPYTLTRTFSMQNVGDFIGDLVVLLEGEVADYAFINPGIDQYEMPVGHSLTGIQIIPDLVRFRDEDIERVEGYLVAIAGGKEIRQPIYFDTQGQEVTVIALARLGMLQARNPFWDMELVTDYDSVDGGYDVDEDGFNIWVYYEAVFAGGVETLRFEMDMSATRYEGTNPEAFEDVFEFERLPNGTLRMFISMLLDANEFDKIISGNGLAPSGFNPLSANNDRKRFEYSLYVYGIADGLLADWWRLDSGNNLIPWENLPPKDMLSDVMSGLKWGTIGVGAFELGVDIGHFVHVNPNLPPNYRTRHTALMVVQGAAFVGGVALALSSKGAVLVVGGFILGQVGSWARNRRLGIEERYFNEELGYAMCLCVRGTPCTKGWTLRTWFTVPNFFRFTPTSRFATSPMTNITVSYRAASRHHNLYGSQGTTAWLNGVQIGETRGTIMNVNQVFFLDLPMENMNIGGQNQLLRQYHIPYGQSAYRSFMQIVLEFPYDAEIAYIGNPNTLFEVRSLPDLAVYPENIQLGRWGIVDNIIGEESQAQIFFYNRGSSGTWAEVEVFVNDVLVYRDSTTTGRYDTDGDAITDGHYRYMAPFSESSIIISWTPTQENNTIRVVLTNRAYGGIFPDRHTHNNEATVNVAARHRQVPVIGEIQPDSVFVVTAGNDVALAAPISNALDVESVYFSINGGAPVQARIARLGTGFENVRASAQLPFVPGNHEVTVTVVYRTSRTTTDYLERTEIITAQAPGQIAFSVDTDTVMNHTFQLVGGMTNIVDGSAPGTFILQKSPAMAANPFGFHLLTMSNEGIIVTNLADLDGALLTLDENYTRQLNFTTGEAMLNSVNINSVQVGGVNFFVSRNFTNPDMILFSDNITQAFSSVSFSVEGFNHTFGTIVPLDPNGNIDLTSHFRAYRFVLPENHGNLNNVINQLDIFAQQTWGNQSIWDIRAAYDNSTRTLTTVILGISQVNTINNASAVFIRMPIVNTLFEIEITNYDAPVVLDAAGHSTISFDLDIPGTLTISNVVVYPRVLGGRQNFWMWGDEILLPSERYGLFVSYTANGHPFTYFVNDLDATANVIVTLPGAQADYPATLTFAWPPMFAQASFSRMLTVGLMSPGQTVAMLEPVVVPAGYNQVQLNMFSQLQNPIGQVSASILRLVYAPDGHNTPITVSNTFSGEAFRTIATTAIGGTNLNLGVRNLIDDIDNNNILLNFNVSPAANHMLGAVTFTNVNDDTDVHIVPIIGTVGSVWSGISNLQVLAPNVDGEFYFTITLSMGRGYAPVFPFAIAAGHGGIITQGVAGYYEQNALIPISAQASAGYRFNGWSSTGGGSFADANAISTTFTMPANAVSVTANFVRLTAPPPPPPPTVVDDEDDEDYDDTDVPLDPLPRFVDVGTQHWAYNYINAIAYRGIMQGVALTIFEPETVLNRAMAATILWRLAGEPSTVFSPAFTDVGAGQWYSEAITWGSEAGILLGIGNNRFNPVGELTREQFAAVMFRLAQYLDVETDVPQTHTLSIFADYADVSEWAIEYMRWANYTGLITGMGESILAPGGTATRAQTATILYRFLVIIEYNEE